MQQSRQSLDLGDRLVHGEQTAAENAGNESFVLDLTTGNYYALGEVETYIWSRLSGESALASIADEVCGKFEVPSDVATADLLSFVAQLLEANLVERSGQ